MKELTIKRLKNTKFSELYSEFVLNKNMNNEKYIKMLSLATIFINSVDINIKRLGYRIIVLYCNQTKDYRSLYEIAINWGIIPVSKFVENMEQYALTETFFTEFNSSYQELYHVNNVYYSEQQKELVEFYNLNKDLTVSIVAPTSYGKTDLIISTIAKCKEKNVCVITPTKSLLAQTKIRIMSSDIPWIKKIITHPEMYNILDKNIIAVLTQERLLQLLKTSPELSFDYVIIDEAHGLLNADSREVLLASVIIILEKRNRETIFKFLTPFLCNTDNLEIKYTDYNVEPFIVSEYIKTEKLYIYDTREKYKFCIYDQFLDKFYPIETESNIKDDISFIETMKAYKNIVYLNKPTDIENFSIRLVNRLQDVVSEKIDEACRYIAEYMHPKYRLISCLKKGFIYHHGAVPDPIRIYIENLYAEINEITYVITSSTLLEGVNLPAESMFILDNKKGQKILTPSHFKNLIGRVCRFSEVFNTQNVDLKKLEPSIYLFVGEYYSSNANVKDFIKNCMHVEKEIKDNPENVLLEKTEIHEGNKERFRVAQEFLENYEEGIIEDYSERHVSTSVGKSCFLNNVNEFDIFNYEKSIQEKIDEYKEQMIIIVDTKTLFDTLNELFFSNIIQTERNHNFMRFKYQETRNFYKMFLDWRIKNASYNEMISSFVGYWNSIIKKKQETLVYMGRWGDTIRDGFRELWIDIATRNDIQKINLAIVRIKDEQDFLDNAIIKYVEVLHDVDLIDETLYLKIKYGTDDLYKIILIKNGISISLAKLLIDKYMKYIDINVKVETFFFKSGIINAMVNNNENKIMVYEVKYFSKCNIDE